MMYHIKSKNGPVKDSNSGRQSRIMVVKDCMKRNEELLFNEYRWFLSVWYNRKVLHMDGGGDVSISNTN